MGHRGRRSTSPTSTRCGGLGRRRASSWCETPTNPLLGIADIAAVWPRSRTGGGRPAGRRQHLRRAPYLQQPLALGADVVVHSTTKYLGGHSDVVGGALVTADEELAEQLRSPRTRAGAVPGPFDCWLVLRGMKTLALRMDRHSDNAERVVELLTAPPAVAEVRWPGLQARPATRWLPGRCAGSAAW